MTYRQNNGISDGMSQIPSIDIPSAGGHMALTDTFIKNTKHSGKSAGDKHTDGGGMYLLVNQSGKYWRMDYRFANKRKTLALGVYPRSL